MQSILEAEITEALAEEAITDVTVVLSRPASREHGHWSTNVALATARRAQRDPMSHAEVLAGHLRRREVPGIQKIEVARPGFINFYLDHAQQVAPLTRVLAEGADRYGRSDAWKGRRLDVEFVSANPTGPLHAGAGRWAAYGDSLSRIFEWCGAEVTREYYLNDRGTQMQLFGASLAARRDGQELPEGGYAGAYISEWAAEMPEGADPGAWGYARAKEDIEGALELMHVHFDVWSSEVELGRSGYTEQTLQALLDSAYTYTADGATWLASSQLGDDKDRVLVKADGEYTYLLPDIAYHRSKFERGFDHLVDVFGADHGGYVARLKAGLAALGLDATALEVIVGQLVTLRRGGAEVRLSKRSGDMVELRDLLEAVGPDVARFVFLLQSIDSTQVIDLETITAASAENPVYYVQYANARLASLEREAHKRGHVVTSPPDLSVLTHDRELDLLVAMDALPATIAEACDHRAPHVLTTWVREFARSLHAFYHECPVLRPDVPPDLRDARLYLVAGCRTALEVGFGLLGISAPESM